MHAMAIMSMVNLQAAILKEQWKISDWHSLWKNNKLQGIEAWFPVTSPISNVSRCSSILISEGFMILFIRTQWTKKSFQRKENREQASTATAPDSTTGMAGADIEVETTEISWMVIMSRSYLKLFRSISTSKRSKGRNIIWLNNWKRLFKIRRTKVWKRKPFFSNYSDGHLLKHHKLKIWQSLTLWGTRTSTIKVFS